jgi:hypothetical protein
MKTSPGSGRKILAGEPVRARRSPQPELFARRFLEISSGTLAAGGTNLAFVAQRDDRGTSDTG